jgi:hypothetical protein
MSCRLEITRVAHSRCDNGDPRYPCQRCLIRVAFLGHSQPVNAARPSGGYISRSEAESLIRELTAERISQRCIRAFAPGSVFPRHEFSTQLPPMETGGCVFMCPTSPSWLMEHAEISRSIKVLARQKRIDLGYDKPKEVYA